jgi:hypothetical protein
MKIISVTREADDYTLNVYYKIPNNSVKPTIPPDCSNISDLRGNISMFTSKRRVLLTAKNEKLCFAAGDTVTELIFDGYEQKIKYLEINNEVYLRELDNSEKEKQRALRTASYVDSRLKKYETMTFWNRLKFLFTGAKNGSTE